MTRATEGDRRGRRLDPTTAPRFMDIATFMRASIVDDLTDFDIAFVGVPYDGAVTNRPGARHGPRVVRDASSMMRSIHPVTRLDPFEVCRVGDAGDVPLTHLYETENAHADIEATFTELREARVSPVAIGR